LALADARRILVLDQGEEAMARMFWPAVAVAVIGLFMLVAGIGPLWLPVLVLLVGVVVAVRSKTSQRQESGS
jgi:hypothetical protein